jgi:hypothetical protein
MVWELDSIVGTPVEAGEYFSPTSFPRLPQFVFGFLGKILATLSKTLII